MGVSRLEKCTMGTIGTVTAVAAGMSWAIQLQVDQRIFDLYSTTLPNTTDTQKLISDIKNLYDGNYILLSRALMTVVVLGTCHVSASLMSRVRRLHQQNGLLQEGNVQEDLNMLRLFHRSAPWEASAIAVGGFGLGLLFNLIWLR
ncbi:MAG: hypothetical protein H0X29_09845 [Parachlamydiaceae bacterium]|nr:hypothetical protein [Parachlamydiaceae bacterium]